MHAHPFRFRWTALICYGGHGHGTKDVHTNTFQIFRLTHKGLHEARHPTGRSPSALSRKSIQGYAVHFLAIGDCRVGDLGARQSDVEFQGADRLSSGTRSLSGQ
jgi:hypothetical protein